MNFAIFKGEKSIRELVKRLFRLPEKGSEAEHEQAAQALLKANPQLTDLGNVQVGSVLRVPPDVPPLHPEEKAPATDRMTVVVQQALNALALLERQLTNIDARAADGANAILASVQSQKAKGLAEKSKDFKEKLPALLESVQAMVQAANRNPADRSKAIAGLRTTLQALAKIGNP
jgi:hypothetical protein